MIFFIGSGYPTHNLEGLFPYPEYLALPSKPPPTERTAEDQPDEFSEESRLGLHQIKLDLVAGTNYAWRTVHYHLLIRRSVVLDNLSKTIPLIDPDQRVALFHAPFKGTTLFGDELAKVYIEQTRNVPVP